MKALSLSRPWDYAVLHLGKDVENRSWATNYRGRVFIHRARSWDEDGWRWLMECAQVSAEAKEKLQAMWHEQHGVRHVFRATGLVGEVDITGCIKKNVSCAGPGKAESIAEYCPAYFSPWFFGPYGFLLANAVAYDSLVPYRGRPGMFDVETCPTTSKPLSEVRLQGCPGALCEKCALR